MHVRTDEVSALANSGSDSIIAYIVGPPTNSVTRRSTVVCSAVRGWWPARVRRPSPDVLNRLHIGNSTGSARRQVSVTLARKRPVRGSGCDLGGRREVGR